MILVGWDVHGPFPGPESSLWSDGWLWGEGTCVLTVTRANGPCPGHQFITCKMRELDGVWGFQNVCVCMYLIKTYLKLKTQRLKQVSDGLLQLRQMPLKRRIWPKQVPTSRGQWKI